MTALTNDGTVYSWGYNGHGELGNGGKAATTPMQIPDLTDVKEIVTGYYHTLVLKTDGTVWSWGMNRYGQLGYGLMSTSTSSVNYKKTTPIQVKLDAENFLTDIVDIGANYETSYALTSTGKVYAWGFNTNGQIGNNLAAHLAYPAEPVRKYGEAFTEKVHKLQKDSPLAYINNYIKEDGNIVLNGRTNPGLAGYQLSTNMLYVDDFESSYLEITDRISYIKLNEIKKLNTQIVENFNMFAKAPEIGNITWRSTDEAMATVDNSGNVTAKKTGAVTIIAEENKYGYKAMARIYVTSNEEGTITAPMVVQGVNFTGVLKADGTVWMAGAGANGKLGQGDTTYRGALVQVKIDANTYLTDIVRIAAGQHYMLAVTKTGEVYAWGQNNNGQLGQGNTETLNYATKMKNPEGTGDLTGIIDVSAGTGHSVMLTTDGKVYAVRTIRQLSIRKKHNNSTKTTSTYG